MRYFRPVPACLRADTHRQAGGCPCRLKSDFLSIDPGTLEKIAVPERSIANPTPFSIPVASADDKMRRCIVKKSTNDETGTVKTKLN